jgi:hypothetical protein
VGGRIANSGFLNASIWFPRYVIQLSFIYLTIIKDIVLRRSRRMTRTLDKKKFSNGKLFPAVKFWKGTNEDDLNMSLDLEFYSKMDMT